MSLALVSKQVSNLEQRLHQAPLLRTIPVVLSDSKAKYLGNIVDWSSHPENKIFWWWKSGADTETQFPWLKENFESKIQELSSRHLTIYIWLGTCGLTEKSAKFIQLRSDNNDRVKHIICDTYKQIYKFLSDYPTIKLVFLELSYYSIYLWNLFQQHPEPEQFRAQD
ncbi:argG [Mytilus coruscus]|uniref:ArgG n=1 Tax=Mytilus coruscus TaxID=42192 RepID=A0A6J8F161_MYTCO|nr:argG [Mytilus coruscus]